MDYIFVFSEQGENYILWGGLIVPYGTPFKGWILILLHRR